jgi:hypothetical protein
MAVPSIQHLLAAWERGRAAPPRVERALALLAASDAHMPRAAAAELPIGERDRRLLALRENLFGTQLTALTSCSECGASLELDFDTGELAAAAQAEPAGDETHTPLSLSQDGYDILFRLPNSLDLLAMRSNCSDHENRLFLLERLVLRASKGERAIAASELPEPLVEALDRRLSLADPHADIRLELSCAACGARWEAPFDIVSFLWAEMDAWALRLLRDVHRLARAYGWREADIIALSSSRRQCYLDLLDE